MEIYQNRSGPAIPKQYGRMFAAGVTLVHCSHDGLAPKSVHFTMGVHEDWRIS